MNTIVVTSTKQNIKFGYEGEDNVTKIIFPYDESWLEYGEGNFEVRILRCGDEVAYTATDIVDDRQAMTLTMTVTDIELSVRGRGEMQLCYVCPDSIKKSPIYQYTVNRSVDYKYAVDPPEGSIIASVEKSLSEIKNTTNRLSNSVISIESSIDDVNSQIDNINDKISEFDEEIDSIGEVETRVDNLETSIQSINGRINTAEGNINENTESISDLNESVTELENRKVTDLETSGGRSDSGKYLTVGTDGKIKATSLTIPPTITVDASLSTTSTNPVQNKVIKTELNNINSNIETCNTEISKINGSLGDVKADLDANDISVRLSFSGEYAPHYQFGWQLGDSSSGSINHSRKYRITSQIVTYESPVTLVLDDGYQLYTVIYNEDGTVKNTISWRSAIMVSAGQKVSITIKRTSEDSSIVLDVPEVLSHLHFLFANCGDYLLFYGNPNNASAISNPVYGRMGSDLISGKIGRLHVRANGYKHFLQTFEADGTKLTDTNFVNGDYEYALDATRTYKIWFARIDNQNIETNDLEKNVAVFMQRSGVPDVVSLNESQLPYVQQLFGGRPSLIGTDHELAFVHFSDVHRSQTNWNRIMQFAKQFSGSLSFAIHTGDFVARDQRGYTNLYENGFDSGIPKLNVVGNHDVYTDFANRTMATKSVTKNLIFPDTSDWGVTWGTDDEPMNYYKDFATEKIRLVVLDCYYDTESQASWLATVLAEAKSLGYAVITATHEVTKSLTEFVDCTFTTKDIDALTAAGLNHSSTPYDAVIKAFKDSGGEHICNLCGHEHVDIIGYSKNGILNVVIGASLGYDSTSSDIYRAVNTRTFDLFNVVSINPNQHLIKIVRIGANTDHYLQGRNVFCYDYQSKKVIANY